MKKIRAHSTVYWDVGGKQMRGKVKQVLGGYMVVAADDATYVVREGALSLVPKEDKGK